MNMIFKYILPIYMTVLVVHQVNGTPQQEAFHKRVGLLKRNDGLDGTIVEEPKERDKTSNSDNADERISHQRNFPGLEVQTDCQRDKTLIRVNFTRPFNGILGVGKLETTKCKLNGSGDKFYELQVRHSQANDCDTQWDNSASSIVNSFFIRQHPHLETGNDIAMTVMCKLAVGDLIVGPAKQTKLKKNETVNKRSLMPLSMRS